MKMTNYDIESGIGNGSVVIFDMLMSLTQEDAFSMNFIQYQCFRIQSIWCISHLFLF